VVLTTKAKHQNKDANQDGFKERQEILSDAKENTTETNRVYLLKRVNIKKNENTVCKTIKNGEVEIKIWRLLLNTSCFKLQKIKHKNKNKLIIVFIEFIYQNFIKSYLFYLKKHVFFQSIITKKTTEILAKIWLEIYPQIKPKQG
jgi:hypothetical protein